MLVNDTKVLPNEECFFNTIFQYFVSIRDQTIINLLTGGKCIFKAPRISPISSRDDERLKVTFMVPVKNMEFHSEHDEGKIWKVCFKILKPMLDFSYLELDFVPFLEEAGDECLTRHINDTFKGLSKSHITEILPEVVLNRGKEMAEVYLYLYCVENSLRQFIRMIWEKDPTMFRIPAGIKNKIKERKKQEDRNKWLPIQGDSDLYYVDFKELGGLIRNNWGLFREYFPSQSWVEVKIDEMAECRNYVAHNSYIGTNEKDVIRTNYNSILKQLLMNM